MKRLLAVFTVLVFVSSTGPVQAQDLQELRNQFNFIVDQAESIYPEIFPPTQETFAAEELGFSWFARFYPSTGVYAALNIDESAIYTLGGPWPEPTLIGDLGAILADLGYTGGAPGGGGSVINEIVDSGSAACVMLQRPVQGTIAVYDYRSLDADGGNEESGTLTTAFTAVTSDSITTEIETNLIVDGEPEIVNSTITTKTRVENGWIYETESQSLTSLGPQQLQLTTTYDPDLFLSPERVCSGMIWTSAAVTSRTEYTGFPLPTEEITLDPMQSNVTSIAELIEVPAGNFETLVLVSTSLSGGETSAYTINWISNALGGIPIRTESYDANDNLLDVTELTSINTP